MRSNHPAAVMTAAFLLLAQLAPTRAEPIPPGAVGQNIEAVGYSNLNDKPGFKMSIQKVGERWYLYSPTYMFRCQVHIHPSNSQVAGQGLSANPTLPHHPPINPP